MRSLICLDCSAKKAKELAGKQGTAKSVGGQAGNEAWREVWALRKGPHSRDVRTWAVPRQANHGPRVKMSGSHGLTQNRQ